MGYSSSMATEVVLKTVWGTKVPLRDLEFLRRYAVEAGFSDGPDSAVVKFAITKLAALLRKTKDDREKAEAQEAGS